MLERNNAWYRGIEAFGDLWNRVEYSLEHCVPDGLWNLLAEASQETSEPISVEAIWDQVLDEVEDSFDA